MQLNNPKSHNPFVRWRAALATLVALVCGLLLTACNRQVQAPPRPVAEVAVVTVQATSVPVTTELSGRVSAIRIAEVRARVAGILLKRNFKEGTEVRAGDVLFEIYPFTPPAVLKLGNAGGFDLELRDRGNLGHDQLIAVCNQLLGMLLRELGGSPALVRDEQELRRYPFGCSTASSLRQVWSA